MDDLRTAARKALDLLTGADGNGFGTTKMEYADFFQAAYAVREELTIALARPKAGGAEAVQDRNAIAYEFVKMVGRLDHSGDEGYAAPEDEDSDHYALDGLIAHARDIMATRLAAAPEPLRVAGREAELERGIAEIMAGLVKGDVGGEDVVWMTQVETLWERCHSLLVPDGVELPQTASVDELLAAVAAANPSSVRVAGEEVVEKAARMIDGPSWSLFDGRHNKAALPFDHPDCQAILRPSLDLARSVLALIEPSAGGAREPIDWLIAGRAAQKEYRIHFDQNGNCTGTAKVSVAWGLIAKAAAYARGNAFPWRMCEVSGPDDETTIATARLIAAAPELLHALKEVRSYVASRASPSDAQSVRPDGGEG